MIRTQIQLPDVLYKNLKRLADDHEMSLAEVIRRAGENYLKRFPQERAPRDAWKLPGPFDLGLLPEADLENLRYNQEFRNPHGGFQEE